MGVATRGIALVREISFVGDRISLKNLIMDRKKGFFASKMTFLREVVFERGVVVRNGA
jgi:hypothetical protein